MSYKYLAIAIACSVGFVGAKDLQATKECEAFNNLKHTKNNMHIKLSVGREYQILREQKGNYFIKVPNANPQTRWVSKDCFGANKAISQNMQIKTDTITNNKTQATSKPAKKPGLLSRLFGKKENNTKTNSNLETLLVLSWHNSFCKTHSNKKECRRNGGNAKNHLVLHGLWPQPRNNSYCGVSQSIKHKDKSKMWNALPKLNLQNKTIKLLEQYMPGYQSNLQRHEYYKHGSCYSKDANFYFSNATNLTKEIDTTLGEFFRKNLGKLVSSHNAKKILIKNFGNEIKNKIAFKCKGKYLSEIWISLKGQGNQIKPLLKNAPSLVNRCNNFTIGRF